MAVRERETVTAKPSAPTSIYPKIPEDPNVYRYSKVLTLEKEIKEEVLKYERLARKYEKGRKIFTGLNYGAGAVAFATGSAAISTFVGGVTILASVPLAAIGGLSTLLGTGFTFISNKLSTKRVKHQNTLEVGKNTLLNLKRMTSKLVSDGKISPEEFNAVIELERNYYSAKAELRDKTNKEKVKKAFLNGQEAMRKKLIREN